MRLFYSLAMVVLALSISAAHAGAFKNEPTDFRGIEWGAAYADHAQGLDLVRRDNDVLVYMRQSERDASDRDNFMKIAYRFYKDRFSAGIIQTYGNEAKRKLRKSLVDQYGEPIRVSRRQELDAWDGERVQIVLSSSVTSYCAAEFISKEMIALEEQETGQPVQVLKKDND
ncbi:MAG: hypothetical protein JSU95_13215 [Betaproteobacteria bacterium]|nr:MAG: hypothetical protein JSU95_13215 [Betaproteobacteria bacterium]